MDEQEKIRWGRQKVQELMFFAFGQGVQFGFEMGKNGKNWGDVQRKMAKEKTEAMERMEKRMQEKDKERGVQQ